MPRVKTIKEMLTTLNPKRYQSDRGGGFKLKTTLTRFKNPKKCPRLNIECGCCDEKVPIYFDEEGEPFGLEINGVQGSLEEWKKLLLPLLRIKSYTDL